MRKRSTQSADCPRSRRACSRSIAIVLFTYLGFTKFANPFASPYTVHAVFANANGLLPDSLVRIAGINVGKVESVGAGAGLQGRRDAAADGRREQHAVQRRRRDDDDRQRGAAAPQGRDVRDPAAHLPRRELLRRRQPRHAGGAGGARQTTRSRSSRGPSRSSSIRCSPRCRPNTRQNLQTLLQQFGTALKKGGPVLQRLDQVLAPGVRVLGDRRARRARHRPPRPVERDQRPGDGLGRDQHPPADPPEPDHELQHDRERVRARERLARERGGRAAEDAPGCDPGVQRAQLGVLLGSRRSPTARPGRCRSWPRR